MVTQTTQLENKVSFPKDESEWYSFLDGNVEFAIQAREYINDLATTAATFKSKNLPGGSIKTQRKVKILKLLGSWKAPYKLFHQQDTYVNPNSTHAHHYSDAVVECGCGVPVLRLSFGSGTPQPTSQQEHKEHCSKIDKAQARVDLLQRRKEILIDQYKFNTPIRQSAQRLGYKTDNNMDRESLYNLGLDLKSLERQSRKRYARTILVLTREYNPETVGKIFGVSRRSVSRTLKEETKGDPKIMYSIRRSVA